MICCIKQRIKPSISGEDEQKSKTQNDILAALSKQKNIETLILNAMQHSVVPYKDYLLITDEVKLYMNLR